MIEFCKLSTPPPNLLVTELKKGYAIQILFFVRTRTTMKQYNDVMTLKLALKVSILKFQFDFLEHPDAKQRNHKQL